MSNTKKYDIFISYSRKDLDEVTALVEMLKARIPAIEIWMDLDGIEAADEFDEKIITAIDASSYVLFMVSNNSNSVGEGSSLWTKKELMYAKNTNKSVVPILLQGAELNSWFLFEFGRVDYINSANVRQVEKLLKILSKWTEKEMIRYQEHDAKLPIGLQDRALAQEIKKKRKIVSRIYKLDQSVMGCFRFLLVSILIIFATLFLLGFVIPSIINFVAK